MLTMFLVCYGADNEFWLCQAEDKAHAVEQFASAALDGEINQVFRCEEV